MLSVKYRGSFLSHSGVTWKVEILKEGYAGSVIELDFPADCPLEFHWSETSKIEPVQPSSATLKVISDTDREFVGLYTVAVGEVRMDVYRDNVLYWSGNIDTELYEEPYSMANGYDVTLTFSDFACLDRLNWSETGFMSIYDIIAKCLSKSGINYSNIVTYISTSTYNRGPVIDLSRVNVRQDNFYDEDGESMTVREILEAVLQPFALRIIQKGGNIYIYDLNALYVKSGQNVVWNDTDSSLGVDTVYNNVTVTFSPYAEAKMMEGTVQRDESLTADGDGGYLFYMDYKKTHYATPDSLGGFKIYTRDSLKSNMSKSDNARFFQVCPIWSGEEDEGIIISMRINDVPMDSGLTVQALNDPKDCGTKARGTNTSTLITCPKAYLGNVSFHMQEYRLRISLSLLFDPRYNFYEEASSFNENENFSAMKNWCNYGYVPIRLTLQDNQGKALYHFENYKILESSGYDHLYKEEWKPGPGEWGQAYLCYYDHDDLASSSGFGGWKTNKQTYNWIFQGRNSAKKMEGI